MHATALPEPDVVRRPATYADIEALPPNVNGEIIDGELFASPRPAPPHFHTASALGALIHVHFHLGLMGPGGWRIFDEPELHVDGQVLVPDIAGWRVENWTDDIKTAAVKHAPDWICEVLSPSTEFRDRARKLLVYARLGVKYAWLVHPTQHMVEVYTNQDGLWRLETVAAGNGELAAVPFEAAPISLRSLWLKPPADEPAESAKPEAAVPDAPTDEPSAD